MCYQSTSYRHLYSFQRKHIPLILHFLHLVGSFIEPNKVMHDVKLQRLSPKITTCGHQNEIIVTLY